MKDETLDKGWEKEFDDEFVEIFNPTRPDASIVKHPRHDDIKQFITNLLAEQKAEIIKRVKKAKRRGWQESSVIKHKSDFNDMYSEVLQDFINIIKEI
jgi:hypothetical protein